MKALTKGILRAAAAGLLAAVVHTAQAQEPANDYPTPVRAEYVFACMESGSPSPEALQQCSCAIDVIASILPYSKYEQASTVLSVQQGPSGRLPSLMKSTLETRNMVANLRRAQAEAEVRCF
jgi:hypothetical protein